MKKLFVLSLVIPSVVFSMDITKVAGTYNTKEDPSISSKVIIDLSKTYQTIDKNFYGSHIDSYSPLPTKQLVDELQLGRIRVGGNEFDVFNWKLNKTVNAQGEIKDIPSIESLSKALANYSVSGIFQMNLTGLQPEKAGDKFVVNHTFTSQSAYEMIKYLNGNLNLKISDISLGNEFSIWNETHSKVWPTTDGISADDYINSYIQFAIAIRKAQEEVTGNPNSIKLWGPEISTSWYDWNTGNFTKDCEWTDVKGQVACKYGNGSFQYFLPYFFARLKVAESDKKINPNGYKLLDYMSIHYYPNFRTKIADPHSVIANTDGQQLVADMLESTRLFNDPTYVNKIDISSFRNFSPNILGRVKTWMNQFYPGAKLAMNEFAVDSDYRSDSYHPIVRPLYLADSIGIFTKEGVNFLNQFLLSSSDSSPLPWSMIESGNKKSLFYMYKLFTNNFKGTIVDTTDNMGDVVNSYAAVQGDMINLALVNKDPVSKKVQIYVNNGQAKKLITYVIPAWSSAILKFAKTPGIFAKNFDIYEFGAKEMNIPLETTYMKKAQ